MSIYFIFFLRITFKQLLWNERLNQGLWTYKKVEFGGNGIKYSKYFWYKGSSDAKCTDRIRKKNNQIKE